MIPEDKVAEIRERTDLVALVKQYMELKRSGTSYKGLCPFHGEKTPSFYVHPDRGFFHCFGCQTSGDAISFLMRIDGHSFPEALHVLASAAGVEIEDLDGAEQQQARQARAHKERLLGVMDSAAGFFVNMLAGHTFGTMAWAELSHRGIERPAVERHRLGYAPDGWDELATFLASRGVSPTDAEQVGLIVPRRGGDGHYDRFRHRLMFPISDLQGRIVAFSGRALAAPVDDGLPEEGKDRTPAPKYINSPETALYRKGEILFGLHEARVELRRAGVALLCEGNFDVVSLAQHGFANVVAPLGTAFTEAQARLLRRFVSTTVLLFDSDEAGRKAARAVHPLFAKVGIAGKIVTLPPGADPDSFLRDEGAEALRQLIEQAPALLEWMIESAAYEAGRDPRARAEAIEALGPALAALDNPVEARLYVERVADAFEIRDIGAVRQQLRRGVRSPRGYKKRRSPSAQPPTGESPSGRDRGVESVPVPRLEAQLVGVFLDLPNLHGSECAEKVQRLLTSDDLRAIFLATTRWVGARGVDASALLEEVPAGSAREWLEGRLAVQEFGDETSARRFIERVVPKLERDHIARVNKRLKHEFLEAKRVGDDARAEELMRRMNESFRSARRTGTEAER